MKEVQTDIEQKCHLHFTKIYGDQLADACMVRLGKLIDSYKFEKQKPTDINKLWSQKDHVLITYADMVTSTVDEERSQLAKQHHFLHYELKNEISTVHILPFFPSSSDDGFSVIDYRKVDEVYGDWDDIVTLSHEFRIMADLVINHASRQSEWFQKFLAGIKPYDKYFIDIPRGTDLSDVTRPRSSSLSTSVKTFEGDKLVWTTFSEDQKDLNFKNPDVLFEFLDIFFFYVIKGIKVVRMDAVAFLWKELGTNCIHLPQTHEIIKLFRTLVDYYLPDVTLITETNVPHKENISYFGEGDEAHMVYQFSLPPLLLHALVTENSSYLTKWVSSLAPLPDGCTYFNFTSSHDGIGMRPLEGLVPEEEFMQLVEAVRERGGLISYKENKDKSMSPYELNITYFDAFATQQGEYTIQLRRYLCSQIMMLSMKGVPGIYFHNLMGTRNDIQGVIRTGRSRTINRKKWDYDELLNRLWSKGSVSNRIFLRYKEVIRIRQQHPAFNPFGTQKVYDGGSEYFILERESPDGSEKILVLCNITLEPKKLDLIEAGLPVDRKKSYINLLNEDKTIEGGFAKFEPCGVYWIRID